MEEMNRLFSILRFPFLHFFLSWLTSDISRSQHEASKDRHIGRATRSRRCPCAFGVCVCGGGGLTTVHIAGMAGGLLSPSSSVLTAGRGFFLCCSVE